MSNVGHLTDEPLPELASFRPVGTRPAVEADLRATLIGMEERLESLDSLDAAMATLEQMWELLPEPREAWDYFSEVIPRRAAELSIRLSRLDDAEVWLDRYDLGSTPRDPLAQQLFDFVAAKIAYRRGYAGDALPVFEKHYRLFGRSGFLRDPAELRFLDSRIPTHGHGVQCTDPLMTDAEVMAVDRGLRRVIAQLLVADESRLVEAVWDLVSTLQGLPSHDPSRVSTLLDLTDLMAERGLPELAGQLVDEALSQECLLDAATQLRIGDILMNCGDMATAMEYFRSAYAQAPWLRADRSDIVELMYLL